MRLNLKLKFSAVLAFIGLVPLIIFSIIFINQVRFSLESQSKNYLENLAVDAGLDIERFISMSYMLAQDISNDAILRSDSSSESEKLEELNKAKDIFKFYNDITLLDTEGNVIVSTDYKFRGDWIAKEWFLKAIEGNITVSDAHTILHPVRTIIVYTVPIYDNRGNITSVVAMQISMEEIWDIMGNVNIGETGYAVLVDDKNRIISHPDKNKLFDYFPETLLEKSQFEKGSFKYKEDGKIFYAGYSELSDSLSYKTKGWKLYVILEQEESLKIFYNLRLQIILIESITLLLIILSAFLFSSIITRPIRMLRGGVKKISKGDLNYRIKIKTKDEINDLADDINNMASDLKAAHDELMEYSKTLEKKVVKRTEELSSEKEKLEKTAQELLKARTAVLNIMEDMKRTGEELEKANKKLKKVDKMRKEFVSHTAHELRTPLNIFRWTIEMLENEDVGKINHDQRELLENISQSNKRLLNLVNNLLEICRMDQGRFKVVMKTCDMPELIDQVLGELAMKIRQKRLCIHWKKPAKELPKVKGDCDRITQVLVNIIDNAIKYTHDKGIITVNIEETKSIAPKEIIKKYGYIQKDKKYLLCGIDDTGMGVPKKEQGRIFSRFFRASNAIQTKIEGTGLGMAIIKNIISMHSGAIWFKSEEGRGTTFNFTIPIADNGDKK